MSTVQQKQGLTTEQLSIAQTEVNRRQKQPVIAWLLWFFLSGVGAHNFYLGRTGAGIGYIALTISIWLTIWILIGIIPAIALVIWWIIDAVKMNARIDEYNEQIEQEAIQKVKAYTN